MKSSSAIFVLTLLAIEFLDEFIFGAREAAWPLIRTDLGLSYAQIGLLLGLPGLVSSLIEPFLGILGDVWKRNVLILGGGVTFALALLLILLLERVRGLRYLRLSAAVESVLFPVFLLMPPTWAKFILG
ncbi:MAG: hypothetical protein SWK90_05555 [Chloroflexota bacterium]|nr:hypothetical protein [Chloroflexota bacterium]